MPKQITINRRLSRNASNTKKSATRTHSTRDKARARQWAKNRHSRQNSVLVSRKIGPHRILLPTVEATVTTHHTVYTAQTTDLAEDVIFVLQSH